MKSDTISYIYLLLIFPSILLLEKFDSLAYCKFFVFLIGLRSFLIFDRFTTLLPNATSLLFILTLTFSLHPFLSLSTLTSSISLSLLLIIHNNTANCLSFPFRRISLLPRRWWRHRLLVLGLFRRICLAQFQPLCPQLPQILFVAARRKCRINGSDIIDSFLSQLSRVPLAPPDRDDDLLLVLPLFFLWLALLFLWLAFCLFCEGVYDDDFCRVVVFLLLLFTS